MKCFKIVLLAGLFAILLSGRVAAQQHLGVINFETSCADEVGEDINSAVALLHHMMYEQAEAIFDGVAEADPQCAMASWGVAMSQLHPLWAPPTEVEIQNGVEAVARAREIGAKSDREQAYIDAIGAFFETDGGFPTRVAAWEKGQRAVLDAYPDDVDAGAFAALAALAVAPKSDATFEAQEKAGALLERLRNEAPEHPGLFHYTIHAYDNPRLADKALQVAQGYDKLAPEVPHALHMPSHVFVRVGMWDDVVSWNRRSADAARKHPVGGNTSMHFSHALDYLVYAHLQKGDDAAALEASRELAGEESYQPNLASAYALAAAPARFALERREWDEAAELPVAEPESFPWADFPAAESITWFARGIGAARTGDTDGANEALGRLDEIHETLETGGDTYWATQTDAQRRAVRAWVAYAAGNEEQALELMRGAADVEDSVDKHPVTPSSVLPARELLGEMLLLVDQPEDARVAFEASLKVSKNRLNSLSGAGRAAELSGDREAAMEYYSHVIELVNQRPDVARPRVEDARRLASSTKG
jgi:tetratricopeptide (TPR) repeat protein